MASTSKIQYGNLYDLPSSEYPNNNLIKASYEAAYRNFVLGLDESILKEFSTGIDTSANKAYCGDGMYQQNGYIGYVASILQEDLGNIKTVGTYVSNVFIPIIQTGINNYFAIEFEQYTLDEGEALLLDYLYKIDKRVSAHLGPYVVREANIPFQNCIYIADRARYLDKRTIVKEYTSTVTNIDTSEIGTYLASTKFVDNFLDDFKY